MNGSIKVILHGILNTYSENRREVFLSPLDIEGSGQLEHFFGMPPGTVEVVVINQKLSDKKALLSAGDVVELYPVFGGG